MIGRTLAFTASFAVPTLLFGVVYTAQGESPVFGIVAGIIGLLGALAHEVVTLAFIHWGSDAEVSDLDEYRAAPNATVEHWGRYSGLVDELSPPAYEDRDRLLGARSPEHPAVRQLRGELDK